MSPKDQSKDSQYKRKKKDMRQTQTPGIGKQPYDGSLRKERPSLGDRLPELDDRDK